MLKLTQEQLALMLSKHTQWTHDRTGSRAYFINMDLRGLDLTEVNLRCAVMRGCNLTGVKFDSSDLRYLDVKDCITTDVSMENADVRFSTLRIDYNVN